MTQCKDMSRNYLTAEGKIAALFVDVDGTLMKCQDYFNEATAEFAHLMKMLGFDPEEAKQRLKEIDHDNAKKFGFERDRFALSLIAVYKELTAKHERLFTETDEKLNLGLLQGIGSRPFFRTPEVFPNAAAVISRAIPRFRLYAVTIGNREAQKYKVSQSGLGRLFDETIITHFDNKVDLVRGVMEDMNIDPQLSAFIGNSKKSDGANLAITNFIYLPLEAGWEFDQAELPRSGFEVFSAKDWREAEINGIDRLYRRRRAFHG